MTHLVHFNLIKDSYLVDLGISMENGFIYY